MIAGNDGKGSRRRQLLKCKFREVMKRRKPLIATCVSIAVCVLLSSGSSAVAQSSSFERDLDTLIRQRDAAMEAALAPIHERFKNAAEQLLDRATQAKDLQTAQKIARAIEENETETSSGSEKVTDLRRDLEGTTWKAADPKSLRPGLGATLIFEKDSVNPGGYQYEASSSRVITIIFRGGDRQDLTLDRGGQKLELTFQQRTIVYEIDR